MIKNAFQKASVALVAALFMFGCSVFHGKSSFSEYADDAKITAKVKTELARNDMLPASSISVETQKGVVQLGGFVSNKAQIKEATKVAKNVEGVVKVDNNLEISGDNR